MVRYTKTATLGQARKIGFGLILLVLPSILPAQDILGRGRVAGTIRDEAGAPIEGVLITAQSPGLRTKLEGKTDKNGRFAIVGFGTGTWQFTASKDGYVPSRAAAQVNQLKTNDPVDLILKKAAASEATDPRQAGLETFEKGNALLAEKKDKEAIAVFEEFLAEFPDAYQARLNIATAAMRLGDAARAESEFKAVLEKALPSDPTAPKDASSAVRALSGLGNLALGKNDFEAARGYFARALEISPRDEAAAFSVGEILFSVQRLDEAVEYFQMAIRIKPSWPPPYYKLGLVFLKKGEYAKALESLNKFVEIDPKNPEIPAVKAMIATVEKLKK